MLITPLYMMKNVGVTYFSQLWVTENSC